MQSCRIAQLEQRAALRVWVRAAARAGGRRVVRGGALTAGPVESAESEAWATAVELSMSEPMSGVTTDCPTGSVPGLAAKCRARAFGQIERHQIPANSAEASESVLLIANSLTHPVTPTGAFPRARKRLANFLLSRQSRSQGLGICVVISYEESDGSGNGRAGKHPYWRRPGLWRHGAEPVPRGAMFKPKHSSGAASPQPHGHFATILIRLLG